MLQNWKNFLGRTLNDNNNWRLEVPVHSKQTDGFNCGMYIVMMRCGMCECYFHKKPHCVGEALHSAVSDTFICKRCEYNVE
ncbi:hypothetical protein DPMN_184806 [Dreissena polymorpha]|uniref:Uncharacterized protein n=1 Tax=Dreissena polymorpha TaxID=45954 RepID=A0A9D4DK95_DREPO|nr:hypothetical protein DPMN_184806 [Dreissena polymorpha]